MTMPKVETDASLETANLQVFDLHAIKQFDAGDRVRTQLFRTEQLWCEIACYEPGQSTVMHQHPYEEEAIYVLEGTAHMNVGGEDVTVKAGSIIRFPNKVLHDVRNLGGERLVIMFIKPESRMAKLWAKRDG